MNYIQDLINQNKRLRCQMAAIENWRMDFLCFLHSEKFAGSESNGERKDWIATGDVIAKLKTLRQTINDMENEG